MHLLAALLNQHSFRHYTADTYTSPLNKLLMPELKTNLPDTDLAPVTETCTNIICSMVFTVESLCSYYDQTSKLPVKSARRNLYIFPSSHNLKCMATDISYSAVQSLSNQAAQWVLQGYQGRIFPAQYQLSACPTSRAPRECIGTCNFVHSKTISFQYSAPMIDFPLAKWDRLLPHVIITLNLLRSSRLYPSLSVHTSPFGNYAYINADAQTTWADQHMSRPALGFLHQTFTSATRIHGHLLKFCVYHVAKQNWCLVSQDDCRQ